MSPARNLVNCNAVTKGYGSRTVLREITLGVCAGERIGVVGRNGEGKSTLLRLIAGVESPDAGVLTRVGDLEAALLGQADELGELGTIGERLLGGRPEHEWAGDSAFRKVLDGLLGGVEMRLFDDGLDTAIATLSGGERRRIALAAMLLDGPELLLLDEPTNHLDVEAIAWLAEHLAARRGAMLVVTHDRWFLDAVCTTTWEVTGGIIHRYDGGYAAYVLARAERERQLATREDRRRQLLRKELAWLQRGPPARTAKPKFRIDAARALIAGEPQPRDRTELLRFAGARLGDKVLEAVDVSLAFDGNTILHDVTWRLGPDDRVALVGVNGSGKTSLLRLLAGELAPSTGTIERGATVRLAHLTQGNSVAPERRPEGNRLAPEGMRVLESLEAVRGVATLSDGVPISAGMLCERFGFRGDRARTPVRELSGGERRRLALMRLLMEGPNVLLLDEPTNDLDIDTLTMLEDLLDRWPGTLVVVSHDRYFVQRVCDDVFALTGDGAIRHLPGGIDQYLDQGGGAGAPPREGVPAAPAGGARSAAGASASRPAGALSSPRASALSGALLRAGRKEMQRLERALERHAERERALHEQMSLNATDHARLGVLQAELQALIAERDALETAWLQTASSLEP
ncbi:MAG: ABC-F family ATP-binding cassette domain-containing protein [Solirubrobacteraceae bacterium]